MEMIGAVGRNPIDRGMLVGKPLDRVEGALKVTGHAPYAYEYEGKEPVAYAYALGSDIAKGRIASLDVSAAERAPGVLLVLTHKNAPKQGTSERDRVAPQLQGDRIEYFDQPVACVVAETFEQARAAAFMIKANYQAEPGAYDLKAEMAQARVPPPFLNPPDSRIGDFDGAFASAPVQLDATYTTPNQIHMQMEPHATMAVWEGDALTIYTANQMLNQGQKGIAAVLQMPSDKVRVVSRYIGGGFGSKLQIYADAVLSAQAAKALKRPVKLALTRQQLFHVCSHRSETIQRIRLGCDRSGKISAIGHEVWCENLPNEDFYEMAADQTRFLYDGENRLTTHRLATLDLPVSASMRAPGEAVGLLALECAMDELAEKLGLDPIELRVINEPKEDPEKHIPFSSRHLIPCMREGARRFGWDRRNPKPAQRREGRWLIGLGMAACVRGNFLQPSKAHVRLDRDGQLLVRTAMTDIGTGSYTVLTQIAGEMLGLPADKVTVEIGDTDFPPAAGSGGSWGAGSAGSAVYDACAKLRAKLAEQAGLDPDEAVFDEGLVRIGNRAEPLAGFINGQEMEAEGEIQPGDILEKWRQAAFGAHFAEVGVDMDTGEIRLRRMLGVFAAGRILNAKTARSQAIGAMTFGIGAALTEEAAVDQRFGCFVNHDMAEYHVPVHADVPAIDAIFLEEIDDKTNPLKSKGVGELGVCGAGAAIANAVYNACGVRIRDYPLTLDKVLDKLGASSR